MGLCAVKSPYISPLMERLYRRSKVGHSIDGVCSPHTYYEIADPRFQARRNPGVTLPYGENTIPKALELEQVRAISVDIPLQFRGPVFGVCMRLGRETASRMRVPEAAVHENHPSIPPVRNVGFAWEALDVFPETQPKYV